jgi:hypothetical protein
MLHLRKTFGMALAALLAASSCIALTQSAFAAGAIAVDDEEGLDADDIGYGWATGATRDEAGRNALAECRSQRNNRGCKVVVRFDTCGAYVVSHRHWGVGWGESKRSAEDRAYDQCGPDCHVVISECD